jgi:hypothetical protein
VHFPWSCSTPDLCSQLPELMLLRGMHDSGCDEIFIIVTDLKRQEMDDVTAYFKLVCRHSFGRTCKPSMERRIQYERESHSLLCLHSITMMDHPFRYAVEPYTSATEADTVFSANRSRISCHLARETTTFPRALLSSNDILFPNLLHTSVLCPRRGHLL